MTSVHQRAQQRLHVICCLHLLLLYFSCLVLTTSNKLQNHLPSHAQFQRPSQKSMRLITRSINASHYFHLLGETRPRNGVFTSLNKLPLSGFISALLSGTKTRKNFSQSISCLSSTSFKFEEYKNNPSWMIHQSFCTPG